jgi:ribosomal protein S26
MEKEKAIPAKRVQTIVEYAQANDITRQTVYNRIKEGKIKTIKLGSQQFIEIR